MKSLLIIPILFFTSCINNINCTTGEGETIVKTVQLNSFDHFIVHGSFDVKLFPADEYRMELEGKGNIIEMINTVVEGDEYNLELKNSGCVKNMDMKINLFVPGLKSIALQGSGEIISDEILNYKNLDLSIKGSGDISIKVNAEEITADIKGSGDMNLHADCRELTAEISGSGDIKAEGSAEELNVEVRGSGNFKGGNFYSESCDVDIKGSGDADVNCSVSLKANTKGSGNITYSGKPSQLNTNSAGSGSIDPR